MEFKIESGIPMPNNARSGRECKYPFAKMNVGDSVALMNEKQRSTIYTLASSWGRKRKVKFSTRKMDDQTIRLFRVK